MAIQAGTPDAIQKREIIKKILYELQLLLSHDEAEFNRRIGQLEFIAELRNVQKIIIEEEENMALTYNIEEISVTIRGCRKELRRNWRRV